MSQLFLFAQPGPSAELYSAISASQPEAQYGPGVWNLMLPSHIRIADVSGAHRPALLTHQNTSSERFRKLAGIAPVRLLLSKRQER